MSVENLISQLRDAAKFTLADTLYSQAADKLEELAAENERVRRERVEANNEWRKAYNELTVKTEAALAEKDKEIAALREALKAMLEPYEGDTCQRDHHGYCQAHFLQEDCCVTKARATLARNAGGKDGE